MSRTSRLTNTSLEVDSDSEVGTVWAVRTTLGVLFSGFESGLGTGDVLREEQATILLVLLNRKIKS